MQERILPLLRCPVSRSPLRLQTITKVMKTFGSGDEEVVDEGILYAAEDWIYPIIRGVPRLGVESFIDHSEFLEKHLPDYRQRRERLETKYPGLIAYVVKKNKRTKRSFTLEWSLYDYQKDRVWEAGRDELLQRFLDETAETAGSLKGKMIFDAGCGNGLLNQYIAKSGAVVLGMDLSNSVERAYKQNTYKDALFIQGDLQFPPVDFSRWDIVHSSGVLICTNNTELSFSCIEPCVKSGGKLSVWLYHPRKDRIHNFFNWLRNIVSRWPLRLQYWFLMTTLLPASYVVKRLKGNRQNRHEMMIALLDWFTPEFRWEHTHDEAAGWYSKREYGSVVVTTDNIFGFNIVGVKRSPADPVPGK
jgi:2-polyprenyl-3-methyl-5-hydroxy-6-metoxy-1,4-benzoquinol methylase